jgi:predicted nuclease with RNAse H fold
VFDKCEIVISIDVGGPRKGFHAVALRGAHYLTKVADIDASSVAAWSRQMGAKVIGIDAPCCWSSTGRARSAERALASEHIFSFATPTEAVAQSRPFNAWMLNGAELYRILEPHYPLFDGGNITSGQNCFETFPQAVACALAGEIVSARRKGIVRRDLLKRAGMDISMLTNIDTVDAALCALTAHYLLNGHVKMYGDSREGLIVVPASENKLVI